MSVPPPIREIRRDGLARHVPRHSHAWPGAAVVLRGGYTEAGDQGRFRVTAGDVVMHPWFDGHQVHLENRGADFLVLPFDPEEFGIVHLLGRVSDPDQIATLAERDFRAAALLLARSIRPGASALDDWPDLLATDLREDKVHCLGSWAWRHGLRASSLSRGFKQCYGISPQRFRLEQRASKALRRAAGTTESLTAIAVEAGFADQAHFSRTAAHLFHRSPAYLRRLSGKCVQASARRDE